LETPEVRARTLCGRTQISEHGIHLLDGVPFSRPNLRRTNRPALDIPHRKRHRISDLDDTNLLLLTNGDMENDLDPELSLPRKKKQKITTKSVHFDQVPINYDDSDESDDDDFNHRSSPEKKPHGKNFDNKNTEMVRIPIMIRIYLMMVRIFEADDVVVRSRKGVSR